MIKLNKEYIFPSEDDGGLSFTISYSIDQYLIVEQRRNLVKAILFVLNPGLTPHDYDTDYHSRQLSSGGRTGLDDISKDIHLEIEQKLLEEGISLMTSKIVQNNSLYVPFFNPLYGSDPKMIPEGEEGDFRWSLHILG